MSTEMSSHERASDLLAIKAQMDDLLREVDRLLPRRIVRARAESYWLAHLKAALGGHGYSSMF